MYAIWIEVVDERDTDGDNWFVAIGCIENKEDAVKAALVAADAAERRLDETD